MEPLWIYLLVFAGLSKPVLQADLYQTAFVFQEKSYVTLESYQERNQPMENITVCLKSYTDSFSDQALFSYSTKDQNKDVTILKVRRRTAWYYMVYIGGVATSFRVPECYLRWQSVCLVWASETGVLALWVDNNLLARKIVRKDYSIRSHASIALGRVHQESTFFCGEILDVYMWNYTAMSSETRSTAWDDWYPGPVINWRNLEYEIKGNVGLEPVTGLDQGFFPLT